MFPAMKILLTGAAGFIGSHLAERLCARGDQVVGFDNFDPFYARELKERNIQVVRKKNGFSLIEGDLTSVGDLQRAFTAVGSVDLVVHLAALAGVRPSIANPVRYSEVNVTGTLNLFEQCRKSGVKKIVLASSSSVYGLHSEVPFKESDKCGYPVSPYAATKRAGELAAFAEHHLHGTDLTCLRFFTVYGPRQRPDLAIATFTRAIAFGKPIELYGDGSTSRDYTWIDDIIDGVVAAIDQLARHQSAPRYRIYNLGGSETTTLKAMVDRISDALGQKPVVSWKPEQIGDMKHTFADLTLSRAELGYAPKVDFAHGIARYVRWWVDENKDKLKQRGVRLKTMAYAAKTDD